jgi:hypothetical protein
VPRGDHSFKGVPSDVPIFLITRYAKQRVPHLPAVAVAFKVIEIEICHERNPISLARGCSPHIPHNQSPGMRSTYSGIVIISPHNLASFVSAVVTLSKSEGGDSK